jgi:hypothetical protein
MNIREELLKEHSKAQALKIAAYACLSPENFKELIHCFFDNECRVAQFAAWSVSWVAQKQPNLILPHLQILVNQLNKKNVHAAVIRNTLRVLREMNIPEGFHGEVMSSCFNFVEDPAMPVAIKSFSLKILSNLSKLYPEIKNELKVIIEERWDTETAAFRASAKYFLRQTKKTNR